ncbi:unnamed protein product [Durusdinium trenchii]|uniref:Uncharacterized protein n=1 Tax=Durusdinium trenchii TaxID=1381693 RepID=A0ABP0K8P2_9DINO
MLPPLSVSDVKTLVKKLRQDYAGELLCLERVTLLSGYTGTAQGECPEVARTSWLCLRRKHTCGWVCSSSKAGRVACASSCFCCVKASKLLKISRSKHALTKAGLKPAVLSLSCKIQEASKEDTCSCFQCQKGH